MKSFEYTITNPIGIHARPAGMLASEAGKYSSVITIRKGEKSCEATRLFSLLGLCAKCGDTVTVSAEGADEDKAVTELEAYFKANL